jgi:hypothetical protein
MFKSVEQIIFRTRKFGHQIVLNLCVFEGVRCGEMEKLRIIFPTNGVEIIPTLW